MRRYVRQARRRLEARFRQAEVEQLRPGLRDDDVAGLQVAVHDAGGVRRRQRLGDLDCEPEGLLERQAAPRRRSASDSPSRNSMTR